jgi:6-pyruvoyltetrahydropterin/6-carboxytetrahydropterin synthase
VTEQYHVRIAKEELVFSAAHFITFAGNVCERLHGHNYGLAVEVAGSLDENSYVIDFIALREALRAIVLTLDHFVLLPTQHRQIRVAADDREVVATFEDRRWVFPRGDCVLLPVANTTAEMLARYICQQLQAALSTRLNFSPERVRIEVDECHGQLGVYQWHR